MSPVLAEETNPLFVTAHSLLVLVAVVEQRLFPGICWVWLYLTVRSEHCTTLAFAPPQIAEGNMI